MFAADLRKACDPADLEVDETAHAVPLTADYAAFLSTLAPCAADASCCAASPGALTQAGALQGTAQAEMDLEEVLSAACLCPVSAARTAEGALPQIPGGSHHGMAEREI